jgi:hypothetical protein
MESFFFFQFSYENGVAEPGKPDAQELIEPLAAMA